MTWQEWTIIALASFTAVVGVVLTLATLPGTWLILLVAIVCQVWEPDTFSWWTIAALAALATLAEVLEFFAGAAGAKSTGGGKHGAIGGVIGALVGAIGGSFILPIVGTVIGAVAGAGIGAAVAEKKYGLRTREDALKIGAGAAAGRLAAIFIKGGIALVMGITLIVAACVK